MGQNSDPMGLQGSYGAQGAVAALRQLIADRLAAEERARRAQVEDRNFGLQNRQQDLNEQFRRDTLSATEQQRKDTLAETTRQHDLADAQHTLTTANTLGDQIPPGAFMEPTDPAVGMMQKGGRLSLLQKQEERPRVDVGPLLPGDTGGARKEGFLKLASAGQQNTQTDNERQAAAAKATVAEQTARDTETGRHNRAMENKPAAVSTVTIQTVDDKGNPVTRVVPKSEAVGKDYAARPSAVTSNRLDSAKAVQQTGEDIITKLSDPKYAATLGPTLGRYSTLQDFVGNPPPEFTELAGAIESYALANMGVHGMRSVQGAEQIKTLLSGKHTPESLASAIRGLNRFSEHFMENAGRPTTSGGAKPSAADLIKKYGGQQ